MRITRADSGQSRWRSVGFIAAVLFWLFLLYGRFLFQITPGQYQPLWRFTGPLVLTVDFLNPIFRSPLATLVGYGVGLGFTIWGALRFWQHRFWRVIFVVSGFLGILFPLLLPTIYGAYQAPVAAIEGYTLTWVTEPGSAFSSAYKQAQLTHEASCDYHLAGWASATTVAYTSDCWPGAWLYDGQAGERGWALRGTEATALLSSSVDRWNKTEYLQQPMALQESSSFPFLTLERSVSPDGQREAVVVRWFYGPSDVVLVERTR